METRRATLGELKELKQFVAVNRKGVKAEFEVKGDSAVATFEDGTQKEMKLDSVRRSWLLVVSQEENIEEESEMEINVNVGDRIKDLETGFEGIVTAVNGQILTVENEQGDFPARVDNVEIIEAGAAQIEQPEVEKPKVEKPKKEDKPKEPSVPNYIESLPEVDESKLAVVKGSQSKLRHQFYEGANWSYHRVTDSNGYFVAAKFLVNGEEVKLKSPSKRQVKKYLKENLGVEVELR